jgi:aerobic-type carbon monoxide dehydrogenase small subunit (CoxS/CutS family)
MPSKKTDEPGFSRRTFLKTVGAGGVAAGVLGQADAATAQTVNAVGPGPVPGACGACTVIIDGRTAYACSTLAIEAQGKAIRTVESFTDGTVLHPLQQAFCDKDGLMCGFCTPGFVTAAVALLEKNPKPSVEEARKALDGNICRCGTYVSVLAATLDPKSATGVRRG